MTETIWKGYKRIDFAFEGKAAILVFPTEPNEKKNWLLKTEYFEAFQGFELQMLARGWHLAFICNKSRWDFAEDLDIKKRFAKHLQETYGLAEKCFPVGMSCGGMIAVELAAKYPEMISALYLDAPVMNLLSCPAGLGKAGDIVRKVLLPEFMDVRKMDVSQLLSYREHPIDKMHLLLQNDIPIILVYGDADDVVPYEENGALLEKYYRKNGGTIITIGKPGCGHHPHGLEDPTPITQFAEKYSD